MKRKILNYSFLLAILWLTVGIIKNPQLSIDSGYTGLMTWFNIIIPSLLPFFIVSEILTGIGFVDLIGSLLEPLMKPLFNVPGASAFALSMSIISGYPVGAKIVSDLRKRNIISKIQAERTICFSSTSGPLFMLGAVSIGMLNNPSIFPLIIYPHYLASLTLGLLLRYHKTEDVKKIPPCREQYKRLNLKPKLPLGLILGNSIKNSFNTILLIGGFIIFYSVLTELVFASTLFNRLTIISNNISGIDINEDMIKGILSGLLEMTTGCRIIAEANMGFIYKIIIINFLIGWSGLSIHSQALNFIGHTDIDGKIYIISKFFHGIFSSIYCIFIYIFKYQSIIQPSQLPDIKDQMFIPTIGWTTGFYSSFKLAIFIAIYTFATSLILLTLSLMFSNE